MIVAHKKHKTTYFFFSPERSWIHTLNDHLIFVSGSAIEQSPHKKGVKGEVVGSKPIIVCLYKFLLRGNKSVCPQFVFIQFGP